MGMAFDNDIYLREQRDKILQRVGKDASRRLYLEFGGKLIGDFHAARVLPGFDPDVKIRLLEQLSRSADIIICIHAGDIERKKIRADLGITYDFDAMRLIDDLRSRGVGVTAVVITRFNGQPSALEFKARLERHGLKVYLHREISGYPNNFDHIVSENGFGANPYIEVTQPLVVVTGPGPNSGKMGTCLSQIYHEFSLGRHAHYAKFETFPVWNLPLNHPVNVAYEAATADLQDANAIDYLHYEAYGTMAVNYNRDLQAFPLLKAMLERISGKPCEYRSPTDMGVNCIASGIVDDAAVQAASRLEIARRYYQCCADFTLGRGDQKTVERIGEICSRAGVDPRTRDVVVAASEAARECEAEGKGNEGIFCGAAIKLPDGKVIKGKNSTLMHSSSSMVLNAIKYLAKVPESQHLLLPDILESVAAFKEGLNTSHHAGLDLNETLIALVVSATRDLYARKAMDTIGTLTRCDMHLTHIPTPGDEAGLRRLGISYTFDPKIPSRNLLG